MHPDPYLQPCHISKNLRIFGGVRITFTNKMEFLAKVVKNYNYFSKALHLRSLPGFWIRLSLNKYPLTCRATSRNVLYDTFSEPCLLLKIQTYSWIITSYSDTFSHIVAYLESCATFAYLEPCHIQNPGIFKTQNIFRTLSRHILVYSERCVTLAYWETRPYSEL